MPGLDDLSFEPAAVIEALRRLRPEGDELRRVAAAFELRRDRHSQTHPATTSARAIAEVAAQPTTQPPAEPGGDTEPATPTLPPVPATVEDEPVPAAQTGFFQPLVTREEGGARGELQLDGAGMDLAKRRSSPPPKAQLLPHRRFANVVPMALRRVAPVRRIDVTALVRTVARAEPLGRVPHRRGLRAPARFVVLLDDSARMAPFRADGRDVVRYALRAFGRAPHLVFLGDPVEQLDAIKELGGGTTLPVLVFTDLGIGPLIGFDEPDHVDWLDVDRRFARSGLSAVYLVPYDRDRWPRPLPRRLPAVRWNDDTNLRAVLHAAAAQR